MIIEKIPHELKERPQWVLWKLVQRLDKTTGEVRDTKVPFQTNGKAAKSQDSSTWTSFENAYSVFRVSNGEYNGIGYVFSSDDPFTGIDIDDCIADGKLEDRSREILLKLNSYTERSQSGTGVHAIVKASKPGDKCKKGTWFEIYDKERFFVVTGDHVGNTPLTIEERQAEVNEIYASIFGQGDTPKEKQKRPRNPAARQRGNSPMSDDDIISIASSAKNGEKFKALYFEGDIYAYHYGDESRADQALCNLLAFYTQDPEQIDRIFRSSGLMREKWEREDYSGNTIRKAIDGLNAKFEGKPLTWFDTGDKGNAERLIHAHGEIMRYCYPFKTWFIWDGKRWSQDDKGKALELAMTIAQQIEAEIPEDADPDEDWVKAIRKQAALAKSRRGIEAMLALAAPSLAVLPDELDADKWLLNVNNGILNLKTGALHSHDPAKLMTKLAPIDYDPNATAPLWEKTIHDIFEDEIGIVRLNEISFLQKALGYSLTGSVQEHAFFIMHGRRGRNGKGVIFNTVASLLGDYSTQINANVLLAKRYESGGDSASPGIAKLKGARLVLASETDRGRRLDEALIKSLTGGDPITARFLHQNEFTFMPEFKIFLQTNYAPNVDGSDQGIWDRIKKIDFLRYFEEGERDTQLTEKLQHEQSGIFRWLVEGCRLWQMEGLTETDDMRQGKNEFQEEMDAIPRYAEDNLIFNPLASVNPVTLYQDYQNWCYTNKEYEHKKREFFQRLEAYMSRKGYTLHKNEKNGAGTQRVHRGIGLKSYSSGYPFTVGKVSTG